MYRQLTTYIRSKTVNLLYYLSWNFCRWWKLLNDWNDNKPHPYSKLFLHSEPHQWNHEFISKENISQFLQGLRGSILVGKNYIQFSKNCWMVNVHQWGLYSKAYGTLHFYHFSINFASWLNHKILIMICMHEPEQNFDFIIQVKVPGLRLFGSGKLF